MTVASDAMRLEIKGLSSGEFARVLRDIGITEKQGARAFRRATDQTMTWLANQARQQIGRELAIPLKFLRKRLMRYRTSPQLMRGKVWFGLKTIDATTVGKGRKLRDGVRVKGQYFFPGAFRGRVFGNDEKIWIRRSSKHFDPTIYPRERGQSGSQFVADSGGRFPVVKARIDLAEAEDIFIQWIARAEARLSDALNRELAVEVRRAGHV